MQIKEITSLFDVYPEIIFQLFVIFQLYTRFTKLANFLTLSIVHCVCTQALAG